MIEINLYRVGGCVRDQLLGRRTKDIDYAVEAPSFEAMRAYIEARGKIYLSKPEFLTVRAKVDGEDRDFVLCRRDGTYSDARRPDSVEPGTIVDDLARRDFTMNAIAVREVDGVIIDPHGGQSDISERLIRAVGDPLERFSEDALRLLRAMRFSIVLGFELHETIRWCLHRTDLLEKLSAVSVERQRAELGACFQASTRGALNFLYQYPKLRYYLFEKHERLWLEPTLKERS